MQRKDHIDGKKHCARCNQWKCDQTGFHRKAKNWDGLHTYCKDCMSAYSAKRYAADTERMLAVSRRYRLENKERRREAQLMVRFGISTEEYNALLSKQHDGCAVCGGVCKRRLHVDHDHVTGRVRGLLCVRCNTAIGALRDSPDLCEKAATYLRDSC